MEFANHLFLRFQVSTFEDFNALNYWTLPVMDLEDLALQLVLSRLVEQIMLVQLIAVLQVTKLSISLISLKLRLPF